MPTTAARSRNYSLSLSGRVCTVLLKSWVLSYNNLWWVSCYSQLLLVVPSWLRLLIVFSHKWVLYIWENKGHITPIWERMKNWQTLMKGMKWENATCVALALRSQTSEDPLQAIVLLICMEMWGPFHILYLPLWDISDSISDDLLLITCMLFLTAIWILHCSLAGKELDASAEPEPLQIPHRPQWTLLVWGPALCGETIHSLEKVEYEGSSLPVPCVVPYPPACIGDDMALKHLWFQCMLWMAELGGGYGFVLSKIQSNLYLILKTDSDHPFLC